MSLPTLQGFKAGGTINVGRCLKLDVSQDNAVVQCTAATDAALFISKRSMRDTPGLTGVDNSIAANSGDSIEVYGPGSVAPALAGAAITRGASVTSDGTGKVITSAGATTRVVGFALESASGANVEINILVNPWSATIP